MIALREKGLAFDVVFFDRGKRPPELEAVGPRAKSPTLFDGDERIFESLVVLEYLEDRYPERRLLPPDPVGRANVRMFQTRVADELMPKLGALVGEALFKAHPDAAKVEELRRAFVQALEPWDRALEHRQFACGDDLTLADITLYTIFPASKSIANVEIPDGHPHLKAWHDRIAARPSAPVPTAG